MELFVRGIHEAIVTAFGQQPSHLGSRLTAQTGLALAAEREERGRTPVLVLDEAHLLSYEQLEAIRMLTNTAMDQDSPLSCLLVGQPTLRRTMKSPSWPPSNSGPPCATRCRA
ncbi:AAA family ATPase [Streptomyces sp. NPDC005271]|uniref:AAA family ATPase n=1 Tax=unclassified Streptomyces TaxID=2593676 RepID=UPI0033AF46C3